MTIEAAIDAIAAEIERRESFHIAAWFVGGLVLFVFGFLAYASFPVDPEAKPLLREAVHVVSGCAPSRFENFAGEQLARNPEGKQSQAPTKRSTPSSPRPSAPSRRRWLPSGQAQG
jgi:hypothetical protein